MPLDSDFDPYHEWLAIPKESRPPTHFQVLGINPSETNPKVIEMAAVRQSAFVRTMQAGAHGDLATRILTEIAEARAVLSDPIRRKAYERQIEPKVKPKLISEPVLRPRIEVHRPQPRPVAPVPTVIDDEEEVYDVAVDARSRPKRRAKPAASSSNNELIKLVVGLAAVVVVAVGAVIGIRSVKNNDRDVASKTEQRNAPLEDRGVVIGNAGGPRIDSSPPKDNRANQPPTNASDRDLGRNNVPPKQDGNGNQRNAPKEPPRQLFAYSGIAPVTHRATGFVMSDDGHFLTTNTVVKQSPKGLFVAVGATAYRAEIVLQSEELDLAILKLQSANEVPSLSFSGEPPHQTGMTLQVFGFQNMGTKSRSQRELVGKIADDKGKLEFLSKFGANSVGGPVVNSKGHVIGVIGVRQIGSGTERRAVMVPASEILEWAKDLPIKKETPNTTVAAEPDPTAALHSVGITLGRSGKKYKTFAESISVYANGGSIRGFDVENDEHNFLLIDEAIGALFNVQFGHYERAILSSMVKCKPVYRNKEVVALIEGHLRIKDNQGPALLAFARFADNAYERLTNEFPFESNHEYKRALAMTGDKRHGSKLAQQLVAKLGRKDRTGRQARSELRQMGEAAEDAVLALYKKTTGIESRREVIDLLGEVGGEKTIEELRKIAPVGRKRAFMSIGDSAENAINRIEMRMKFNPVKTDFNSDFTVDFDIYKQAESESSGEEMEQKSDEDAEKAEKDG